MSRKKNQYEKEILEDFIQFLKDDNYLISKNLIPKYTERVLRQKGNGEGRLINFNLTFDTISDSEIGQKINYFISLLRTTNE